MTARLFLVAVFFVSGFAALLYQTIWQRVLSLFGGADVYAATIIVAAFMTGLGFGSLAGGHIADRLTPSHRIRVFAGAEFAVGVFALASPWIFYDVLYGMFGGANLSRASISLVVFLVVLWPTFFMGVSLPVISRIVADDPSRPARWLPLLYGWNTLGAACGAFAAIRVLLSDLSLRTNVYLGASLSIACGVAALLLSSRLLSSTPHASAESTSRRPAAIDAGGRRLAISTWLCIYALAGFIALSLEIIWFRVLGVVLKADSFTFGYLLTLYLTGLGLGALLGQSRWAQRFAPTPAFFLTQAAIVIWSALSMALFVAAVGRLDLAQPLWDYMASRTAQGAPDVRHLPPVLMIVPATTMMGLSFGFLQRAVQTDLTKVGRRIGWLQTANIIGSATGALVTGLVLIDRWGSAGALRLLVALGIVFVAFHVRVDARGMRARGAAAALLLLAVIGIALPGNHVMWSRLHVASPSSAISSEDATGVVLLKPDTEVTPRTDVFLSGINQSWLPYGGVHSALGALPVLLHPNPRHVAVIGLASGDTAFSIGGRPETTSIESIEIIAPQFDVLEKLDRVSNYPGLRMLLQDDRVHHQFADARAYLRRTSATYDVIEADPLLPKHAGAGNLYSVEYFELLRSKLNEGGLAVTWIPSQRTLASFLWVFPNVLLFGDIAVGSETAIMYDPADIEMRLRSDFTASYYASGGVDIRAALSEPLASPPRIFGADFDRTALTDLNRDLDPRDEFGVPDAPPVGGQASSIVP